MNATLVRVLARAQATRGRLGFAFAGAAVLVLIAGLGNAGPPSDRVVAGLIANSGVGFLVPVVSLLFAVACLGDLAEDRTLVYLWLRPVPRVTLASSAVTATVLAAGAPVVGGLMVAAVVAGQVSLLVPGLIAGTLGVAGYGALFVALGIRSTRSLLWGLAYVLLWEGVASNLTLAFARLSLRRYVGSLYVGLADRGDVTFATSAGHAAVVLLAVTVAGVALTAWLLRHSDID